MRGMLDEIQDGLARIEAARTLQGYRLIVPPDMVEACRVAAGDRGWTGLAVVASSYVPDGQAYLFRPPRSR